MNESSFVDRVFLIVTMLWNMPFFIFILPIYTKLFRKPRDEQPNSPVRLIAPHVYQFSYWSGQSNTTVIQGRDKSLLVYLPGPPQASTLAGKSKTSFIFFCTTLYLTNPLPQNSIVSAQSRSLLLRPAITLTPMRGLHCSQAQCCCHRAPSSLASSRSRVRRFLRRWRRCQIITLLT